MSNYGDWKSGAISYAEYNRYCRMEDDQDQAAYDEKERISKLVDDVEDAINNVLPEELQISSLIYKNGKLFIEIS